MLKSFLPTAFALNLAMTACTKPENDLVDDCSFKSVDASIDNNLIDQGVSDIIDKIHDQFVLEFDKPVTLTDRDLNGVEQNIITPGRVKYTYFRNMKLRRTVTAYPFDKRPEIGSYEFKIMSDFIFNYSKRISEHFSQFSNLNFKYLPKRSGSYFAFEDPNYKLEVDLIQDSKILINTKDEFKHIPYILDVRITDLSSLEVSSRIIDFDSGLNEKMANTFMRLFKLIVDSDAFNDELYSMSYFRESDKVTHPETVGLPYYHSDIRSIGYFKHNRVFADAICKSYSTSNSVVENYDNINTPSVELMNSTCLVLTSFDSDYAKHFASVYDKFEGTYPVLLANYSSFFNKLPYKTQEPLKMKPLNVGFKSLECSLLHLTIDNGFAHSEQGTDKMLTPFHNDQWQNGNMKTPIVHLLTVNGKIVTPTFVTRSNFNTEKWERPRNNVAVLTYSDANLALCKPPKRKRKVK